MKAHTVTAAERRAQIDAVKKKYEPRPRPKPVPKVVSLTDERLRRLTAQVLDGLKLPGAIPSNVILAALKRARDV